MNVTPRDFPWTGTGGLSDVQSYQWIIHNAIYDRLSTSSFFSSFAVKRTSAALPVEAYTQIPFIGIFFVDDMGNNDGDVNAGDIRLLHNFTIGVQIVVKNNDPTTMLQTLDRAWWFALNQLLRDNTLMNRLKTTMPDNVTIEGVPRLRLPPDNWGLAGAKNETPLGERVFFITYQIRTEWYPTDFPDLERIDVTTAFPFGGDAAAQADVQQVKVVYEFNPDSVPTPLPNLTPDPVIDSDVILSPRVAGGGVQSALVIDGDVIPSASIAGGGLQSALMIDSDVISSSSVT